MSIFKSNNKPSRSDLVDLVNKQHDEIMRLTQENHAQRQELEALAPQRERLAIAAKLSNLTGRLDALLTQGKNL